jgi:hypothetical protein
MTCNNCAKNIRLFKYLFISFITPNSICCYISWLLQITLVHRRQLLSHWQQPSKYKYNLCSCCPTPLHEGERRNESKAVQSCTAVPDETIIRLPSIYCWVNSPTDRSRPGLNCCRRNDTGINISAEESGSSWLIYSYGSGIRESVLILNVDPAG